jgi:acyl-CoA thioester hydrolase
MEELLKEYNVVSTAKVQWGDMDAMQHVNNTVYVKWGEIRIDYFIALGVFSPKETKVKFVPILGFQSVKYIIPVVYPDTIHIIQKVGRLKPIGLC